MLTRIVALSGSGSGSGTGSGSGGGGGAGACSATLGSVSTAGSGGVAHAASSARAQIAANRFRLVTEPDTQDVDLRGAQPAAQHVEFVQVLGRADVDTVVVAVVYLDALDV